VTLATPFPRRSAPALHAWLTTPREPNFDDFHSSDYADFLYALDSKNQSGSTFALMLDSGHGVKPVGFAAIAPASPVLAFFAGVVIAPAFRGRGFGRELLTLVWDELQLRGFRKATASFFADNEAIRATFESAGAAEEGVLRRAALHGGELVDMRMYSFTALPDSDKT
jgi:RimJ/RimL family protein N-acetyltransferase